VLKLSQVQTPPTRARAFVEARTAGKGNVGIGATTANDERLQGLRTVLRSRYVVVALQYQ
jgi:hypothetical protein